MANKNDRSAKARGLKLVSFEIDDEIWREFKILSIYKGITSSAYIRELIQKELLSKKRVK